MRTKPLLFPASLVILISGMMIAGGYDVDKWSVPRAIMITGLVIALAMVIRWVPADEEEINFIADEALKNREHRGSSPTEP